MSTSKMNMVCPKSYIDLVLPQFQVDKNPFFLGATDDWGVENFINRGPLTSMIVLSPMPTFGRGGVLKWSHKHPK